MLRSENTVIQKKDFIYASNPSNDDGKCGQHFYQKNTRREPIKSSNPRNTSNWGLHTFLIYMELYSAQCIIKSFKKTKVEVVNDMNFPQVCGSHLCRARGQPRACFLTQLIRIKQYNVKVKITNRESKHNWSV